MLKVSRWAALLLLICFCAFAKDSGRILRWAEGQPGCTFSADDDGFYRYGLWTDDFGIVAAVDADELRKANHRTEPTFAVLLTIRYRGKASFAVAPDQVTLEFVKHDHDVHPAIDPDAYMKMLQKDFGALAGQIAHEVGKHSDRTAEVEAKLRDRQSDVQAAIKFVENNSLRAAQLDSDHPQATGWVFFSAKSKWIGDWKSQEEFVLRVRLAGQTVEFPFALPPTRGDLILRRRAASQ